MKFCHEVTNVCQMYKIVNLISFAVFQTVLTPTKMQHSQHTHAHTHTLACISNNRSNCGLGSPWIWMLF